MIRETMLEAEREARRFLKAVGELKAREKVDGRFVFYGCAETGALRRASMDLTRVLAKLRRSS